MSGSQNSVDWSKLAAPQDDGAAKHLIGMALPSLEMPSTLGRRIPLSNLSGTTVIYVYPMTAQPGKNLPENWDMIPGARGCTPQSCAFRDVYTDLRDAGATRIFGLSTQNYEHQVEAATRLQLPFPLLSDASLSFANALRLPRFEADGQVLLKRLTLISRASRIMKVFYPVFPPDQDAENVLHWLQNNTI